MVDFMEVEVVKEEEVGEAVVEVVGKVVRRKNRVKTIISYLALIETHLNKRSRRSLRKWQLNTTLIKIRMIPKQPRRNSKRLPQLTKLCPTKRKEKSMMFTVQREYRNQRLVEDLVE